MNNYELELARKLLNLSKEEAAKHLGENMGKKTWDFLERYNVGNYGVKPYIAEKLRKLLQWRRTLINNALNMVSDGVKPVIVHYNDPEFFESYLDFKAHNSATSTLNFDYGFNLIVFNEDDYLDFIEENDLDDTTQNVARWATEKYLEIREIQKKLAVLEEELEAKKSELLLLCDKIGFTRDESIKFVNQLNTISRKGEDSSADGLAEFLVKRLPHTLYHAENAQIKANFTQKTQEYFNALKTWGYLYHETKLLIEGFNNESTSTN